MSIGYDSANIFLYEQDPAVLGLNLTKPWGIVQILLENVQDCILLLVKPNNKTKPKKI